MIQTYDRREVNTKLRALGHEPQQDQYKQPSEEYLWLYIFLGILVLIAIVRFSI